jgi:nucleotide-binding universal stress UspA family protein
MGTVDPAPDWSGFSTEGDSPDEWNLAMIELTRILVPVDFSDHSQHAVAYAVGIARWYGAGVTALHVFVNSPAANVIPSLYPVAPAPVSLEPMRDELMTHVRGFVGAAAAYDVPIDVAVEEAPDVHREILVQAEVLKADLIVMGTHGRGALERFMVGSTTEKVLRKATSCPVMVVPPRAPETPVPPVQFHRILCPVDFSEGSLAALTYALSLAEEADAHLTLLHAIELTSAMDEVPLPPGFSIQTMREAAEADRHRRLDELVPDNVREYCTVHTMVVEGRASRAILRVAAERDADLIVMGVHGRGAFDLMLFGSNTHHVVRAATCPVLTVQARGARA